MEYKGQLHGKVDKIYFPLMHTSDQFDRMHEALKRIFRLRNLIEYDPLTTKAEHQDEGFAIHASLKEIESILNEIEENG